MQEIKDSVKIKPRFYLKKYLRKSCESIEKLESITDDVKEIYDHHIDSEYMYNMYNKLTESEDRS